MKPGDERDRELDALLREPLEDLTPPAGTWERVRRGARRRKLAKAALALSAVVAVIVGTVAGIAGVRHDSNDERLTYGTSPSASIPATNPSPAPTSSPLTARMPVTTAVPPALRDFRPESVSFISQRVGYLWGSVGMSKQGTVARTPDGGKSWQRVSTPPIDTSFGSSTGDSQIRFASATLGFIFGPSSYVTLDGGSTWQPFATKGYVEDIETVQQRVWALIRTPGSQSVQLYMTTVKAAKFHRVAGVPAADTPNDATGTNPGVNSIALSGPRVDVLIGGSHYYTSPNGRHFIAGSAPCPSQSSGQTLTTALVTSWGTSGVVAGCGYNASKGNETKLIFTAGDGRTWQAAASQPTATGYMQTLSASAQADLIIGSIDGAAQASTDTGRTWRQLRPQGVTLSFAGYISPTHIVAIADDGPGAAEFTTSRDTGQHWHSTLFK